MKGILLRAKEKIGRCLKEGENIHFLSYKKHSYKTNFMIFANQTAHKKWHKGEKVSKEEILFNGMEN